MRQVRQASDLVRSIIDLKAPVQRPKTGFALHGSTVQLTRKSKACPKSRSDSEVVLAEDETEFKCRSEFYRLLNSQSHECYRMS